LSLPCAPAATPTVVAASRRRARLHIVHARMSASRTSTCIHPQCTRVCANIRGHRRARTHVYTHTLCAHAHMHLHTHPRVRMRTHVCVCERERACSCVSRGERVGCGRHHRLYQHRARSRCGSSARKAPTLRPQDHTYRPAGRCLVTRAGEGGKATACAPSDTCIHTRVRACTHMLTRAVKKGGRATRASRRTCTRVLARDTG